MKKACLCGLAIGAQILSSGCATLGAASGANVSYLDGAQNNFNAGERAFSEERYEDAVAFFEHVRSKFPYSKFTAESDLRIADAHFEQKNYEEAAEAYDFFLKFHPRHEKAPIALFRLAKSHYEMIPSDFFLFPRSYVKDQAPTAEALRVVTRFLEEYPTDANANEASELKKDLRNRLAKHDMYVAAYYAKRKKWPAALGRYETVANTYADLEIAAEALYQSATIAGERLKDVNRALGFYERIIDRYGGTKFASYALDELAKRKEPENNIETRR